MSFGRGKFAGTDYDEQDAAASFYTDVIGERLEALQRDISEEELARRQEKREKRKLKNLHWSQKVSG